MLEPWKNPAMWHAMNVHLPIALVLLGLPAVAWVAITRGRSRALRWGLVAFYALATVTSWFAAETGERAMERLPNTLPQAAWDRINFHEAMAEAVWILAAATTVLLLLSNIPRRWARQTFTTLALVASVISVGWVAVTAHSGGVAVYEHNLGTVAMHAADGDRAVANVPASRPVLDVAAPVVPADGTSTGGAPAARVVSYTRDIKPVLERKCAECHAGSERKGGFDISTIASMARGGEKGGAGIVPGKPGDSALVQYIDGTKQPRMPKSSDPLDAAIIADIRAWIAAGAVDDAAGPIVAAAEPHVPQPPAPLPSVASSSATPTTTATATPTTLPAEEPVSEAWDPQVKFRADEANAVRRYVRMKSLKPVSPPPEQVDASLVFNPIDRFIIAKYPTGEIASSAAPGAASTQSAVIPVCDDSTFVRRVYLDAIGMIPTADEARQFVESKDEKRREKLVDALLARVKDYAAHWVPFWEDALTSNGLHQGGVGTHGNYREWIFRNFEQNKPYDTLVQELIDPSMPNHPGRYILNDNHMRTIQSASDVAQVFLGTAIKCASCHSHFDNDEWPQKRAVAFSGYFASKDLELIRCERSTGEFVQTHFMFDLPAAPTSAPADPNARIRRVAQLITDPTNPRFARTIVNRLWKRYMGLGLIEPADDFREDIAPSHPELLDWLADDFIRHGCDIKRTTRLILTSRTYQLRYNPALEDKFDIEKPAAPRFFRSPALRRLTAEQLLDSIAMTTGQKVPEKRAYLDDKSTPLTRSLGRPAARNEVSTQRPDDTAVVQALELLNGPEFATKVYQGALIDNAAVQPSLEQLVEDVYWSAFSRPPSAKEKAASAAFIKSAPRPATTQPIEVVWIDDAIPTRATPAGAWRFAGESEQPVYSGKRSHAEPPDPLPAGVPAQHLFTGVNFPVAPDDILFTYAYLDPEDPPKELMLQFHYNGDWRRAAWGADGIAFKPKQTLDATLPAPGKWVRLEVPASRIGIDKPGTIAGVAYTQLGGKVYWDKTGASKGPPIHDPAAIGDMLWALIVSPEFQYLK